MNTKVSREIWQLISKSNTASTWISVPKNSIYNCIVQKSLSKNWLHTKLLRLNRSLLSPISQNPQMKAYSSDSFTTRIVNYINIKSRSTACVVYSWIDDVCGRPWYWCRWRCVVEMNRMITDFKSKILILNSFNFGWIVHELFYFDLLTLLVSFFVLWFGIHS